MLNLELYCFSIFYGE